jgi:hypothetical protein
MKLPLGIVMFNRFVSLALIAAVFGCPLWCSLGMCQCSVAESRVVAESKVHVDTNLPSCCSAMADNADCPRQTGKSFPQRKSDSLRCQGICGGAVLESPCQLPSVELCLLLSVDDDDDHCFLTKPRCGDFEPDFPECIRGKNQGRSVRIRHMSFQC